MGSMVQGSTKDRKMPDSRLKTLLQSGIEEALRKFYKIYEL
jgi:hypothetical protein